MWSENQQENAIAAAYRKVRIPVLGHAGPRTIAIEDSGDQAANDIFLCLPGILETSKVFASLDTLLGKGKRIVVVNFAGRADSDYLPAAADYRMGTCVADIVATIAWLRGALDISAGKLGFIKPPHQRRAPRIHILGNSMGGLLGTHVASRIPGYVHSLILNDVGCMLPWSGLVQLFGAIGRASLLQSGSAPARSVAELARSLDVDPRLVAAVLNPSHLDLPHASSMQGIGFDESFAAVDIPVLLMYSSASALVTPAVLDRMRAVCVDLRLAALPGERHPLPFDASTAAFIVDFTTEVRGRQLGDDKPDTRALDV